MGLLFQVTDNNLIVTNWGLIALLCLPGIIYGFRRGWQEEGFTAIGLGLAVSGIGQAFGVFLITLANRIAGTFPIGIALITRRPVPPASDDVIPLDNPVAHLVAFALIVLVAYRAGMILGQRRGMSVLGRLVGMIFGGMNVLLILARTLEILNPLQKTTVLDPPSITILGVPSNMLKGIVVGLVACIIALFLALAWLNRRRARE